MKMFLIFSVMLTIFLAPLRSQELLNQFNELPATKAIKGPEFDIAHKYDICFDETMNLLLIRDESRNPETGKLNFEQRLYEVPINFLTASSFVVEVDKNLNEIILKINLSENIPQIHTYWISEGEIVSILIQSRLGLGPWEYSEKLESRLKLLASDLGNKYASVETKQDDSFEFGKIIFKYGSSRATMIGEKELDGRLNNEYYFPYSITNPPQFRKKKQLELAELAMKKSIKNQLGMKDSDLTGIPIFVYLDENGKQESVFIGINGNNPIKKEIDLDEFRSGGKNNGEAVKCKFVIIM